MTATTARPNTAPVLTLGLPGYAYADLYEPQSLARLYGDPR